MPGRISTPTVTSSVNAKKNVDDEFAVCSGSSDERLALGPNSSRPLSETNLQTHLKLTALSPAYVSTCVECSIDVEFSIGARANGNVIVVLAIEVRRLRVVEKISAQSGGRSA